MRANIEFEVIGTTLDELKSKADAAWQEFIGDDSAKLPNDAELIVRPFEVEYYAATVVVRMKVEE